MGLVILEFGRMEFNRPMLTIRMQNLSLIASTFHYGPARFGIAKARTPEARGSFGSGAARRWAGEKTRAARKEAAPSGESERLDADGHGAADGSRGGRPPDGEREGRPGRHRRHQGVGGGRAYYRAAKAAIALGLLPEAAAFCRRGIEQDPANEELKKLLAQVDAQQSEQDRHRAKVAQAVSAAKDIVAAIEKRGLKLGKAAYQELTGVKKPKLDEQGVLHWPVLLLYPEVMSSDFIEDFPETDTFVPHLDAGVGTVLSKSEILKILLEGTMDSKSLPESLLDEEDGENDDGKSSTITSSDKGSVKWINVKEGKTLQEVLQHKDFIIPAIPVFFVVSRKSTFYRKFKAGNWSLP
ncbi:Os03g0750100 [Oryza sativa Japonica Group]|uniref:Os03g0750100 protein n=1 Tax=Oryza sativa subsp. japonica TaxID=39947 RepID=A0A0P0W3Z6_ORYSJ|nr:hypothetical protein EE612_020452 [Oryza sativa]BAS86402.1 Os03g0750100 [Oryza sativa Japonica Group]